MILYVVYNQGIADYANERLVNCFKYIAGDKRISQVTMKQAMDAGFEIKGRA